jgi:transposase
VMWYFLWDNDKKHTSDVVRQWLHNNGITQVDYPPYSPDINIIENVWNNVKARVELRNAKNENELKKIWEDEWNPSGNLAWRMACLRPNSFAEKGLTKA